MADSSIPGALGVLQPGSRLTQAFEMARELHSGQPRKGTKVPYLAHPMTVCAIALGFGADEDQAIAALLHDTAEDAGGAKILSGIEQAFGADVAAIVHACSDSLTEAKEEKPAWKERKKAYLARLKDEPARVHLVVAADKLHNLQSLLADLKDLGPAVWTRFNAGPKDQGWYYEACLEALAKDPGAPWSAPLRDAVQSLRPHLMLAEQFFHA